MVLGPTPLREIDNKTHQRVYIMAYVMKHRYVGLLYNHGESFQLAQINNEQFQFGIYLIWIDSLSHLVMHICLSYNMEKCVQFIVQTACILPVRFNILASRNSAVLGVVHNCHHFHERTQRTLGGGGQGQSYAFLNVVYSDGNEIIEHVRRTSMTKNPLVRNSLLVQKLVT